MDYIPKQVIDNTTSFILTSNLKQIINKLLDSNGLSITLYGNGKNMFDLIGTIGYEYGVWFRMFEAPSINTIIEEETENELIQHYETIHSLTPSIYSTGTNKALLNSKITYHCIFERQMIDKLHQTSIPLPIYTDIL